jgi:hypothetical protein
MKSRFNSTLFGALLGFLLPVITFLVFFLVMRDTQTLVQFIGQVFERNVFTQVLSLAAVPNLLLFFIFIWLNYLYSARGVLMSTFVLALFVLGYKWLA